MKLYFFMIFTLLFLGWKVGANAMAQIDKLQQQQEAAIAQALEE